MKDKIRYWIMKLLFSQNERYEIWAAMTHHTLKQFRIHYKLGVESDRIRELFMKSPKLKEGITPAMALKEIEKLQSEIRTALLTQPENISQN